MIVPCLGYESQFVLNPQNVFWGLDWRTVCVSRSERCSMAITTAHVTIVIY